MKTLCGLTLGLGNATLAATLNGPSLESLAIAAFATSIGLAGVLSWRWLLSRAPAQQPADVQTLE
jgi:predicted membrane-bound spermidine synthase